MTGIVHRTTAFVLLAAVIAVGNSVQAAEAYIDPDAITATASSVNYQLEPIDTCNGNGLTGDLHTNNIGGAPPPAGQATMWLSNGVAGEWIRYEFDRAYSLNTMWVWNYNQNNPERTARGIRECTIEYSLDGVTWTRLDGTHTFAKADGTGTYAHNTEIDFGGVKARYVKITVISNHGHATTGLSEVRFYAGDSLGFETEASGDLEAVTPARVAVVLTGAQAAPVTVDYTVSGGTAAVGADFSLAGSCGYDLDRDGEVNFNDLRQLTENWLSETLPARLADGGKPIVDFTDFAGLAMDWLEDCGGNTLRFRPGQTSKTIYLDVVSDGVYNEPDETIVLELSNVTGGEVRLDAMDRHTYTIIDTRPKVAFQAETSQYLERTSVTQICVALAYPSSEVITVDYEITGGTAVGGGVDYMGQDGTLTFDQGETAQFISIRLRNNYVVNENKTIELSLSNPTNASLGPVATHTCTIADDDAGAWFDGMRWYNAHNRSGLTIDSEGRLQWYPQKGSQMIVNMPEQRFSEVGDVVIFSYIWTSTGDHDPSCECYKDYNPDPDIYDYCTDITCVGGTGDFRMGLFDSNGKGYITDDRMGENNEIFRGYLGYQARIFPHVPQDARSRFSERKTGGGTESHTNTSLWERSKPTQNSALLSNSNSYNRLGNVMSGGFGIPVGGSALMTFRLERVSESRASIKVTCNGKTWSKSSESTATIPQKIDVFAIWSNGNQYDWVKLAVPEG